MGSDAGQTQDRVVPTFPVLFFGSIALFLWLVLLSRLAGRVRLAILAGVALVVGAGFLLLEIKAVDGNLVPILGLRWGGGRQFEDATAGRSSLVAPGAHDYPQFYGPRREITVPGPVLARNWSEEPPRELWRRAVGDAWSSFAIVGNAAVTQEQRGDDEIVARYDLRTGEQVWVHAYHAPFHTTIGGSGPRTTPTIDGGRVYSFGATGTLACLDVGSGREIWSRNVVEDQRIRRFIDNRLNRQPPYAGLSRVEIERTRKDIRIFLHTARPGLVIGPKGQEVDKLRECLEALRAVQGDSVDHE